jgi:hypothetical protein
MRSDVAIQYQDASGNWITIMTVPNEPPVIRNGVKSVATLDQNRRVRALDQEGRLIDLL